MPSTVAGPTMRSSGLWIATTSCPPRRLWSGASSTMSVSPARRARHLDRALASAPLSSRHARQDEHFAARRDRPEPVVAVDLAVDRHRDPAVDERLQLGMILAEAGQQLMDVRRLDLQARP